MKTFFIVERPTQIITALAILDQLKKDRRVEILVANCFDDAGGVVNRLAEVATNANFKLVPSYADAINNLEHEEVGSLFIHWDVGFKTQKKLSLLRKRNVRISVFEEGIGTYRKNIYPPFKKFVFSLFGLPINVGGSKYIEDIYVYDKERYEAEIQKKPPRIYQIETGLFDFLIQRRHQFLEIFSGADFINSVINLSAHSPGLCSIYLSSWEYGNLIRRSIEETRGAKILKLHPFNKTEVDGADLLVSPRSLPAELLIAVVSSYFESVNVYHLGSSVEMYVSAANVNFINIGRA